MRYSCGGLGNYWEADMRHASILFALVAAGLAFGVRSALAADRDPVLVLVNATVIDGFASEPQRDITIVIRKGRIESVARPGVEPDHGTGVTIDLEGRWLLPGLIDAHVHLFDTASARTALRSGVTTARSLGAPRFADVAIRDAHRAGAADLPEVLASGYQVRRRLADVFFADFPELGALKAVATTDDVRKVVDANAGRGVDVIKVLATERAGDPKQDMLVRDLTDAQLSAAVSAASARGLKVAAHAHSDKGVRAAILAGVRTVEHGTLASDASLELMKERRVCFVPTLSFWSDMAEPGGTYDDPILTARAKEMRPRARATTACAAALGVQIAAGSDMSYNRPDIRTLADEIADLVDSGLTPMAAIQSATSVAAKCLGIEKRTGRIAPGFEADLIAVDANPLENVSALKKLRLIVNDGEVAFTDLAH
jgi:imidazolonepropionase-like amidohydrolase